MSAALVRRVNEGAATLVRRFDEALIVLVRRFEAAVNAALLRRPGDVVVGAAKHVLRRRAVREINASSSLPALHEYLVAELANSKVEKAGAAFYHPNGKCVAIKPDLFAGGVARVYLSARSIATEALRLGATSVVVFHCHPNGPAAPSFNDRSGHAILRVVLGAHEIGITDNLIVAGSEIFSYADAGILHDNPKTDREAPTEAPAIAANPWIHSESNSFASLVRALVGTKGDVYDFVGVGPPRLAAIIHCTERVLADAEGTHAALRAALAAAPSPTVERALDATASQQRECAMLLGQALQTSEFRPALERL